MQARRSSTASSCGAGELSAASTTSVCGRIAASAAAGARAPRRRRPRAGWPPPPRSGGAAPANRRRRPSAWSAERRRWREGRSRAWRGRAGSGCGAYGGVRPAAAAGRTAAGEHQVDFGRVERQAVAGAAQRALHQRVGRQAVPVLGHALAVGAADHLELVADHRVERGAELDRLVDLGQHHAAAAGRAVGDHHVLDRLALRRGVDDQQPLDARCDSISSSSRVRASRCAMPAVSISTIFLAASSSSRSSSDARSCAVCTGTPRMRP